MLVVDTNILIYAANEKADWYAKAHNWLEKQRTQSDAWYSTWPVLFEFLRVTTHPKVMKRPWTAQKAWQFVSNLLASPGLQVLSPSERHTEVASVVFSELPWRSGNFMHDAHIAILMREHGVRRIYTRDTDFHRFPFLEVIDPLAANS